MQTPLKTTRPVMDVRTIEDVEAIESRPYDDLVPARNLYDLFRATAQEVGTSKAVTVLRSPDPQDVGASFTHGEFLREITRAANMFRKLGLSPGNGVAAFLCPTLPELPALLIGAQVAGVASSINYLLSRDAIADLLTAEEASILVVSAPGLDPSCWEKAEGLLERVPSLRQVVVIGDAPTLPEGYVPLETTLSGCPADRLTFEPTTDRDSVCAIFHTGGTTGRPKLVRLTHGNQIHAAFGFAQVYAYSENDTVMNGFPFFHVGGTMTVGLAVMAAGGHIVIPSPYALRPPEVVERYWDIVRHFGLTVVSGVPTSIGAITRTFPKGETFPSVRMAGTGGAVLPKAVGERFTETTGIPLFETYGMTETAAAIAFNPGRGTPLAGSVGFRAPYSETRIVRLGVSDLELCGPGEPGNVQVRGPQVFPGYADPAHNAGTLADDGWLTTGDVGYMTPDQRLVLTGREKDLIVRSGHNIDPAAIEDVANQFPGVAISAAVGMPDQYAGEVPALFVVAEKGQRIDTSELRAHLETHVHERPALPRSILEIEALPVTAVGKIFKPALRDLAIEEKVRAEAVAILGADAMVTTRVTQDEQRNTHVDVTVVGAEQPALDALSSALAPLPQTFQVRAAETETAQEHAVLLTVEEGIATLTLNRPDSLNAMSQPIMKSLERHVEHLANLPGLRAIIVTGNGRGFSAGGDLIEFEAALKADKQTLLTYLRTNMEILQRFEDLPVPIICAVNGVAVAGGLEMVLCCDIVVAAEGAKMGDGHARYAIVPAAGATVRLRERISPSQASQLLYTAGLVDAETMQRWGLVNEVVSKDQLMDRVREIAREIAACSPEVVRHMKELTGPLGRRSDRHARMEAELERFALHVDGNDLPEGLTAFREKRRPQYI